MKGSRLALFLALPFLFGFVPKEEIKKDGRHGLEERVLVEGLSFPLEGANPSEMTAEVAFPRLRFTRPVFITHAPNGQNELYVVEQTGVIRAFDEEPSTNSTRVFVDIRDRVRLVNNEEGLIGLTFDPNYATNGFFYVYYAASRPRRTVLSRFGTVNRNGVRVGDPNSERVILEIGQPFGNHNGGMIEFGPDGMLYVGVGDGGSANDPLGHGQNRRTLLATILRIDPHVPQGSRRAYRIPEDNPFVGDRNARPEIWAFGARNPWRFSFDRLTGELWVGDVGQNAWEEIHLIREGGENLGWNVFEGTHSFRNPDRLPLSDFSRPVHEYPHSLGRSITGGYVYRGDQFPSLRGSYVYGDFVSGRVWALVYDGESVVTNVHIANIPTISSFGENRSGEIYVTSFEGQVWKLRESDRVEEEGDFPELLSETGIFANLATLEPTPGVLEYEVNVPFWSDGSEKRRWIALPGEETIDFDADGAWTFPQGTVLVKHFEVQVSSNRNKRLETRVLVRERTGWSGYSYEWNEAQTDAVLLSQGKEITYGVEGRNGRELKSWSIPSRAECLSCHTSAAGRVLGLNTRQLNREKEFPLAVDNQIRTWNHIGLFNRDLSEELEEFTSLPDPFDEDLDLNRRARSYLEVNCAQCHRPGGPTPSRIDLLSSTPLMQTFMINEDPGHGDLGLSDPKIVLPGNPERSTLFHRVQMRGAGQMPPLNSLQVDERGVRLIQDWIESLE